MQHVTGNITDGYRYDAYGATLSGGKNKDNHYQFVGRMGVENQAYIGLLYMRNRWYDPSVGRFVTQDPSDIGGGLNLYQYVNNNPINGIDPLGLCQTAGQVINTVASSLDTTNNAVNTANALNSGGTSYQSVDNAVNAANPANNMIGFVTGTATVIGDTLQGNTGQAYVDSLAPVAPVVGAYAAVATYEALTTSVALSTGPLAPAVEAYAQTAVPAVYAIGAIAGSAAYQYYTQAYNVAGQINNFINNLGH